MAARATPNARRAFAFAIAFLVATRLSAQDDQVRTKIGPSFLDRTYVIGPFGVLQGDGSLIFEAQVRPTLFLANTVEDRLRALKPGSIPDEQHLNATTQLRVWSLAVAPEFNLRMYSQASSPVKTPSAIPHLKARWGLARIAGADNCLATAQAAPLGKKEAVYRECIWTQPRDLGMLIVDTGHYSNGQDGCLFEVQQGIDGLNCSPPQKTLVPLDHFATNKRSGSFSIGFWARVGIGLKRFWLHKVGGDYGGWDYPVRRALSLEGTFEFQPRCGECLGGEMPDDVRRIYGDKRIRIRARLDSEARGKNRKGTWSFTGIVEGNSGHSSFVPRVSFSAEVARTLVSLKDAGVFVRYYQGQDYYNVHFLERTRRIQFGLVFEQIFRPGMFAP